MRVENLVALRYILEDELYLLREEKPLYENKIIPEIVTLQPEVTQTSVTNAPIIETAAPLAPVIEAALQSETLSKVQILASVAEVPKPDVTTPTNIFNYLGQNLKQFLILTHYTHFDHIADAHLTALQNILKRKELTMNDIAIFNMAKANTGSIGGIIAFFKPSRILILGMPARPAGWEALALNTIKTTRGINVLCSYNFDEMMDNVEYKKTFWEQMKNL